MEGGPVSRPCSPHGRMRTSILPGNDGEESGVIPRCWYSAVTGPTYNKAFCASFNPDEYEVNH
ncbi:hypothetical protein EMIT0324P_30581 [Pseudomonas chlororaphis]